MSRLEQNTRRLDIPVNSLRVGVFQRISNVAGNSNRGLDRQLAFPGQSVPERFTVGKRHDIERETASHTGIVNRKDVRMVKTCRDLDLPQKPVS